MKRYRYFPIMVLLGLFCAAMLQAQTDEWPQIIEIGESKIVVYQPQPESFEENHLSGRAAVSVLQAGEDAPVFGAIWFEARVVCDRVERMCGFEDIVVPVIRFPETEDGAIELEMLREILEENFPKPDYRISMDRLLASLDMAGEEREQSEAIKNDPPEIIYRKDPSMLVLIDGEPQLRDYEKHFQRVINTPFFIVRYDNDKKYYLYGSGSWFSSPDLMQGWAFEAGPPGKVKKLGKDLEKDKKKSDEPPPTSDDLLGGVKETGDYPEILVRTSPAELIQTDGEPDFRPIQGTELLYLANTETMLFLHINTQQYYVVLSGRWFTASGLNGPWSYVSSDKLPEDFSRIPEGSDRDMVLAYVAGTDAAREAVVDAYIPETATVDRKTATTEVEYDGSPQFVQIPGTDLHYASNTASTVLRTAGNQYYCVDNGVWFESDSPSGPWKVATRRPEEVKKIPPSSPVYNVKYVYIYDYTPEVVYVGYTPGYVGCFVYGPTIVYGTGWYYRPWYGTYYYPHHWTWGFHMQYNPWTGWGFGWSVSWGYPGGWYYPPYWGWYRPPYWGYRPPYYGGWWGPGEYRPPVHYPGYGGGYYGPRPNQPGSATRPGVSTRPAQLPAARPNNIYRQARDYGVISNEARPSTRPARPSQQPSTRPSQQPSTRPVPEQLPSARPSTRPGNDVYTDPQGNIYRRDQNGNWQQRENRQWESVPGTRPTQQPQPARPQQFDRQQMERYNYQRQRGDQRTQRAQPRPMPSTRQAAPGRPRGRN